MAVATIKLAQYESMFQIMFSKNPEEMANRLLKQGCYLAVATFAVDGRGEAAAEEVFDLTNNPSRQDEREQVYGQRRSVSVGDIVEIDGDNWLCLNEGWWKMT